MRALLLTLLFLPLPALAQAQGLFDDDGEPVPWPTPRRYAAPALLRTDSVQVAPGIPGVAVYVEGADGERGILVAPTARPPVRVIHANGWTELTQGCGPDCLLSYLVDRERGRVAGPLAQVLDVDVVRDRVVAAGADGLVVLDPFEPASARAVALPFDLAAYAAPHLALRRVAFVLGEDALDVTVRNVYGEEESFLVPLAEGALTTLPVREGP
jgi:hypothetical protein